MLILECSQGCYGRTEGSVTISLRNFVGEEIKKIGKRFIYENGFYENVFHQLIMKLMQNNYW